MKYSITHKTEYTYQQNVSLAQNHARLTPLTNNIQRCLATKLTVTPTINYQSQYEDSFSNLVNVFEVSSLHKHIVITAYSEVEITPRPQWDLFANQIAWEAVRDALRLPTTPELLKAAIHCVPTAYTMSNAKILDYTLQTFTPGRDVTVAVSEFMTRIFTDFAFDSVASNVDTTAVEVIEMKKGVCQDFVHLALSGLRAIGLAARYVSGYIETIPPKGEVKLIGADATHAWFAVYVPDLGWLEFDPTNNIVPHDQHVTLACGRDYNDVAPLKGVIFGGGAHRLSVSVDMNRIK